MDKLGGSGDHSPGGSGVRATDPAPLIALVVSLLVGPVGAGLAAWWLRNREGTPTARNLAKAAIAVGLVQTLLVGWLLFGGIGSGDGAQPPRPDATSAPTPSYPSTPPPSAPPPNPSATPVPPNATSLDEFVPEGVGPYQWEPSGTDTDALAQGATEAVEGTFSSEVPAGAQFPVRMAEWPSAAEAAAHAQQRGEASFPGVAPLGEGPINSGAGHYWYYERDGVGTVFWYLGQFSAEFSGEPRDVQEFFLAFPR